VKRQSSGSGAARRHRSLEEKAEILSEHRRSGLSLLAFARKRGLCYASLVRWRSRQHPGGSALVRSGIGSDPGFVPVRIESEVGSGDYVLSWEEGRSLKIPRQFDAQSLRRLLGVLEEAR